MSPYTNPQYGSTENLTISNQSTTTHSLPLYFMTQYGIGTTPKAIIAIFNSNFDKQDEMFDKQHEGLVNLATMSLFPTEDTKLPKEETSLFHQN